MSTARCYLHRPRVWITFALVIVGLMPATASAAPSGAFSCRASAARITLAGGTTPTIEPFVANGPDAPCMNASTAVLKPTTVGPLSADAVNVATMLTPQTAAVATSTVTDPGVALGSNSLVVHASVVSATAAYRCVNGAPQPLTSGQVVGLTINGQAITVPSGTNVTIPLGPLGTLVLNQVISNGTTVVRRAVALVSPLGTIVLSEAIADFSGSPCAVTPAGSAELSVRPAGAARLIAAGTCVSNHFEATVTGREISRVVFFLGGRRLADRTASPYRVGIEPTVGRHLLTALVTFAPASATAPRTLRLSFTGCPPRARLVITPRTAARLIAAHMCLRDTFFATVVGTHIQRVAFSLDGTTIATRTRNPFRTAVAPTPGEHTLLARVTFQRSTHARARTLRVGFRGCPLPAPPFTG
ncbi:MAG TPA: choice-of-anchor P family protein [Solirubrobacteraceae bacterium]|nr:choice-of-anchor P family protein [Solirubrobacteraceae bacterium]